MKRPDEKESWVPVNNGEGPSRTAGKGKQDMRRSVEEESCVRTNNGKGSPRNWSGGDDRWWSWREIGEVGLNGCYQYW